MQQYFYDVDSILKYIDENINAVDMSIKDALNNPDNPQDIKPSEGFIDYFGDDDYYELCKERNHLNIVKSWFMSEYKNIRAPGDIMLTPKCCACEWYSGVKDYSSPTARGGGLMCNYCKKFMRAVTPFDFCSYHTQIYKEKEAGYEFGSNYPNNYLTEHYENGPHKKG